MILTFDGTLTEADHKAHVPVAFDVPPGTTRLSARFTATPDRAAGALFDNLISLSLFGPAGARGARHNNPDMDFAIDAAGATPGYTPGAPEAGRWTVYLDTFRVLGPDPVRWQLEITLSDDPVAVAPAVPFPVPADRGPGWYRGDLHAHTLHSDGTWDVPDLVGWARARGLDFLTVTDHNTVSSHAPAQTLADDALLVLGGSELTTHSGHALTLGHPGWQEWRTGPVTGRSMPEIATEVRGRGALFVIAHPMAPGDPACTGCRWEYADMMPGNAGLVEIWNGGPWSDYNEDGLRLFRAWLAQGHRLRATAGSDVHGDYLGQGEVGFNHVLAEAFAPAAILAAVRAGRNYLSSGPRLVLTARGADGVEVPMGGQVTGPAGVAADWSALGQPMNLRLVGVAGVLAEQAVSADQPGQFTLRTTGPGFVMAELRDAAGRLHAVTNPIFLI
jgi:hypothetical protein